MLICKLKKAFAEHEKANVRLALQLYAGLVSSGFLCKFV